MAKTIIVSNRLPIRIQRKDDELEYKTSEGGLATGLGSIYKEGDNVWVGWPGVLSDDDAERQAITQHMKKENMHPVFLTEEEIRDYYEGFSNETLWPNFHYFNQYVVYDDSLWEAYQAVNLKFAQEVLAVAKPDDIIWVHDYQLLLLPQMLREKLPNSSIAFFQHIPFPSYEIFRTLPWRKAILQGMLGADLIGFHTYDDMRHFLSSASRLAGIGNQHGRIDVGTRRVFVESFPMGIDYEKYANAAAAPDTLEREVRFRTSLANQQMILSIDRLDYSKGIPQRLRAYEMFLERYEEYREKVSLILLVVPSRDQVEKYKELKEEVELLVGRINGKFSRMDWTPVHYFYRSLPLPSLSAMYRMAHVALVTPMRDGMNLVCKEFIASKLNKKGVLILSEMAGASKELSDAILVNPNDIEQIVDALYRALTMPEEDQVRHMETMQASIKRYNIHQWVKIIMERLGEVKEVQQGMFSKKLDKRTMARIEKDFAKGTQRMLFLDYDGTLSAFKDDPLEAKPDAELLTLLSDLSTDSNTRVVVISGRGKDTLAEWLGHLPVDFIAEHGVWYREQGGKWETNEALSKDWKTQIRNVFELYVDRTPGSFIEEKDFSLVWHYRKVETGLGELRTRELCSHVKYLTSGSNLQVLEGDMVVEVKSSEVNKGKGAGKWLKRYPNDFVLAVGDDWTDEDTFRAMPKQAYTIKVGSKTSAAHYYVDSVPEVRTLLHALNDVVKTVVP